MIIDVIANHKGYRGLGSTVERALKYLADTDFTALEDGKHGIEGDEIFALLLSYETEPESARNFEAHDWRPLQACDSGTSEQFSLLGGDPRHGRGMRAGPGTSRAPSC